MPGSTYVPYSGTAGATKTEIFFDKNGGHFRAKTVYLKNTGADNLNFSLNGEENFETIEPFGERLIDAGGGVIRNSRNAIVIIRSGVADTDFIGYFILEEV